MTGGLDGEGDGDSDSGEGDSEEKEPTKPRKELINIHAWIQTLSWAVLAVMGLIMSRLARHWKYWMQLHISFEVSATVLSFVGEMVGFAYSEVRNTIQCFLSAQIFCSS